MSRTMVLPVERATVTTAASRKPILNRSTAPHEVGALTAWLAPLVSRACGLTLLCSACPHGCVPRPQAADRAYQRVAQPSPHPSPENRPLL